MSYKPGDSIAEEFITNDPTTGAAADATGTPTATLVLNGTDNGASMTVTNVDTGRYKVTGTMPGAVGDKVQLKIAATVGGVAAKMVMRLGVLDNRTSEVKSKTDNLPSDPADASDVAAAFSTVNSTLTGLPAAVWAVTTRTLSSAGVQAIWDALTSALTTTGSIGKYIVDKLLSIDNKTTNLPSDPADASDVSGQTATAFGSVGSVHVTAGAAVPVSLITLAAGTLTNADSLPTFELFKDAGLARIGSAANFALLTGKTGRYVGSIDTTGLAVGHYRVDGTAIIGGKTVTVVCAEFRVGKVPANVLEIDDRDVTVTNDADSGLPVAAIATS